MEEWGIPEPQGKTSVQIKFHTYSLPALPEGIPRPLLQKGHYQEVSEEKAGDREREKKNDERTHQEQ